MLNPKHWREYALLMRLDRPIGNLLLLWPTLWALWIAAAGWPDWHVLTVFVLGVLLMRAAGCVINDYADRDIDAHVARTQHRPLAAGRVSSNEALALFALLTLSAFALVLTLNWLTIGLSFIGAALAASYPFMKRFTHLPQAYLGIAFGWAVPMAFAAQTHTVPMIAWLLLLATLLWAVIYDTFYAITDREDDRKIGVKSTAILFGQHDRLIIGILQIILLGVLIIIGQLAALNWPYYLGIVAGALFFAYQQWLTRHREPQAAFQAFLNNNWFGAAVFGGIFVNFL